MKKYWFLLILPVALLLWWGIGRGQATPTVHFAQVTRVTIESTVSTNGKVEPAQSAAARAETAGTVRTVSVQRGQTVAAGQTLVTLDTSAPESELAAATAREQEARAELATLGEGGRAATVAEIDAAIASAQSAVEVAQRNYDVLQRLAGQQAATKLQVQQAHDEVQRSQLQLSSAQARRRTLVVPSDRTVAQARVRDAEAAVALAEHRMQLSTVTAPIAGTVYEFDMKVGTYLQPGELVAQVGVLNQMKVTVYVDEPDLGRVGKGMPVRITWDARPGQTWWGHVDRMPTEVIALGTRTVGEVTTLVDNPTHDLLPGVTVNATIVSKVQPDAVSIPKGSLHTFGGRSGVYKLVGNKLQWTPVLTGVSDVNNVELTSGLAVGERVADRVVEPSDAEIKSGMRIRVAKD
jgi:HlyD family secretion protein